MTFLEYFISRITNATLGKEDTLLTLSADGTKVRKVASKQVVESYGTLPAGQLPDIPLARIPATLTGKDCETVGGYTPAELIQAAAVPVGATFHFPCLTAPVGYLELNGQEVSRTGGTADLWSFAVGSGLLVSEANWQAGDKGKFSYGVDGVTSFRIPDTRERFIQSAGYGHTVGMSENDGIKAHTHTIANSIMAESTYDNVVRGAVEGAVTITSVDTIATVNSGANSSLTATVPKNVSYLHCIKY